MRSFVGPNGVTWSVRESGLKSRWGGGHSYVTLEFISSDSSQTRYKATQIPLDKMSDEELADLVSSAQESKQ